MMIWEDLSLDFISDLPPSHGFLAILVIIDRFTKGIHFRALPPKYTAHRATLLFMDTVSKLHGFPYSLVSDHDPLFINTFWCK